MTLLTYTASDVGREDFKGVGVPISMACVENDPIFPDDVRNHGVGILASSGIEHETIMYPGMPHGKHKLLCFHGQYTC